MVEFSRLGKVNHEPPRVNGNMYILVSACGERYNLVRFFKYFHFYRGDLRAGPVWGSLVYSDPVDFTLYSFYRKV